MKANPQARDLAVFRQAKETFLVFAQPPGALSLGRGSWRFFMREDAGNSGRSKANRLADSIPLERRWCSGEDAQLAALRVVLGLPRRPVVLDKEET